MSCVILKKNWSWAVKFVLYFGRYRYVDETFTMFENKDTANGFLQYLDSHQNSIKFTIEFEQDNEIPFLDILVKRYPDNTFVTSIYRKKTFTGLYTKWDSFTPRKYKINVIRTLTYRCYRICSSASLLQSGFGDLRRLLLQNGYPQRIIIYNVNDVLNRNRNKPRSAVSTVPKKDIIILLPYFRSPEQPNLSTPEIMCIQFLLFCQPQDNFSK